MTARVPCNRCFGGGVLYDCRDRRVQVHVQVCRNPDVIRCPRCKGRGTVTLATCNPLRADWRTTVQP